jgi:hypothetical protein
MPGAVTRRVLDQFVFGEFACAKTDWTVEQSPACVGDVRAKAALERVAWSPGSPHTGGSDALDA